MTNIIFCCHFKPGKYQTGEKIASSPNAACLYVKKHYKIVNILVKLLFEFSHLQQFVPQIKILSGFRCYLYLTLVKEIS